VNRPHIAYACVGIFSTIFLLVSLFVKEKLYIGEATVATIAGLILGPHCLGWFDPVTWGNTDYLTLELLRIVLCIQIVAVAVELPRKYMKRHWVLVAVLLLPVMTIGWLVVGLFIWALIPHFDFPLALLVLACVTATDPILAAAVVGKGKFAERVPGHLRNLLSAESGCNDGMAFPFIYLLLNLIIHAGDGGEIVKDWILVTVLYECIFGAILGVVLGFLMKRAVAFCETKRLIDRESFLALFVFIAFNSAGIGSMLGVDDLLMLFAAGTAFGWNGDFAKKTEELHVLTVIDLLLNLSFFVYFGAIIPWPMFNDPAIGLNVWRLIVLAIVVIFLRRMPAVLAFLRITPDIKLWREALFCGHFGPIGVGAIFALILARKDLEEHYTHDPTPLRELPLPDFPHYQLLACIWPIVCFIILTSIIVHGSLVAVLTLGKRLNRMAITMSFTTTNTQDQGPTWMQRLQKLDKTSTSFLLHRIDSHPEKEATDGDDETLAPVETSGIKVRPAGGARRKHKHRKRPSAGARIKKSLLRLEDAAADEGARPRPQAEFLQLGRSTTQQRNDDAEETLGAGSLGGTPPQAAMLEMQFATPGAAPEPPAGEEVQVPAMAYQEGNRVVIEDEDGEIVETFSLAEKRRRERENAGFSLDQPDWAGSSGGNGSDGRGGDGGGEPSIHSEGSFRRQLLRYSTALNELSPTQSVQSSVLLRVKSVKKAFKEKALLHHKVYAHQVDNMIVIENEEGDIIRRYRVNRHMSQSRPSARLRSGSLVGRALSRFGKRKEEEAAPPVSGTPQEGALLVKEHDLRDPQSPLRNPLVENRLELKIADILRSKHASMPTKRPSDVPEEEAGLGLGASELGLEDSQDLEASDEDILEETEVEKKRRLAALGLRSGQRRDDDEEE
jgi:Na(+)/H(+) antiporter